MVVARICYQMYTPDMVVWLDLDGLEEYLKIPKSTLYRMVQQGRLPGHKIGRTWRFDRDAIDNWIKAGGSKPGGVAQEVVYRDHGEKSGVAS